MPEKLLWTEPRDARLKRMRSEGWAWDAIAAALGVSRNAAIERGRRIGARLPPPEHRPDPEDPERPPLPPGHPVTWGAIVAGTLLGGTPYPLPVPGAASVAVSAGAAPEGTSAGPDPRPPPPRTRAAPRAHAFGTEATPVPLAS